MGSVSFGLDIALRALQANQQAIEVVSHNIANANTPGYSRQRVDLKTTPPYAVPSFSHNTGPGQMGTGVAVDSIQRVRDTFLDYQIRSEQQTAGEWEVKRDAFQQVEMLFNEPSDSGLNSLLGAFWGAWQEVSNKPEDAAVRVNLLEQGRNLTATLRRNHQEMVNLRQNQDRAIQFKVDDINSLATRVSDLNTQIVKVESSGQKANDLRDQRDNLIDELSSIAKVSYSEEADGSLNVFLGGSLLVHGGSTSALQVGTITVGGESLTQVEWATNSSPANVSGGQLKGLLDMRNVALKDQMDQLQAFTARLISDVNGVHASGYDLDGGTGISFFTGTGADDIEVNPAIQANVRAIAVAASSGAQGDGVIAVRIAQLQHTPPVGEGSTVDSLYREMIARLGVASKRAETMYSNQQVLVDHLGAQKQAGSGVSLDEEAISLIKYQRSYEAAARFVNVMDEMLDVLINRLGLGG